MPPNYSLGPRAETDPAVKGEATNDDGLLHMIIEFDHNGDGNPDGQTITDHEGKFTYKPADRPSR